MVTIGGARIKVTTKNESDDEDDVSTSATIILPTKTKPVQNGVSTVSTSAAEGNGTTAGPSNGDCTAASAVVDRDLSAIFLEKKNQTNKLTDINDSVSYQFKSLLNLVIVSSPPPLFAFVPYVFYCNCT